MVSFVTQLDLPFQATTTVKLNFAFGKHEIFFCLRLLQEISPTSTKDVDDASWFLDNGATHHVTAHCDSLASKTKYSINGKLMVDDGTCCLSLILVNLIYQILALLLSLLLFEIFS